MAEAGRLLVAVSGPSAAVQKVMPLLRGALARDVIVVSDAAEKAVLLKTIGYAAIITLSYYHQGFKKICRG